MLEVDLEKVCFIVVKAHELDVKVDVTEPAPGSNAADDECREILEDYADDATRQELREFLEALNTDETANVVALMWLGRGDFDAKEWKSALREAYRVQTEHGHGPDYLIGTPLLANYLEEGLSQLGLSCEGIETGVRRGTS
jgi:hypothetical protein